LISQAINFYPLIPKRSGFHLTKNFVIFCYIALVIALLGIYFTALWNKNTLQLEYNQVNTDMKRAQDQLAALSKKYPISDIDALNKSIRDLQTQYDNKSNAINLLSPYAHFSAYLSGIANAIVENVWVTEITFAKDENKISVKGHSVQSSQLELFIGQLAKQPVFTGMIFELKELKDKAHDASFADFDIFSKQVTKS
jgi:hypothetical protein